jgi:uncharacterized protein (TIGR00369 family)
MPMTDTPTDVRAQWREQEKLIRSRLTRRPEAVPLAALSQQSGAELLTAIMAGALPPAPIGETLDFFLAEVEPGRVVFQGNPQAAFYNPLGSVHGGWSATLLDSCVGCAIHSMLPAGKGYTTVELKVNFVRAVMPDSGPLRAEGKIINLGNRIGTAEGRLSDASGRLYAHATTTCLIFDLSEIKREKG